MDIRKYFFTEEEVKLCNGFPRVVVDAPDLAVFEAFGEMSLTLFFNEP